MKDKYPKGISPSFRKRANEAAFWETWVGTVLSRSGLYTIHHPFLADGGDQHGQSWDLDVTTRIDGQWLHVECKSLNLTFDSPKNYPYNTCLICSDNSWKRKWGDVEHTARDFLFVSRDTGCVLWLPIGSPSGVRSVTDGERGETFASRFTDKKNLKPLWDFIEYVKETNQSRKEDGGHVHREDSTGVG